MFPYVEDHISHTHFCYYWLTCLESKICIYNRKDNVVCYIDFLNDDYMSFFKLNTIFLIALLIMILCMYFMYIIICLLSKQYSVVEKYEDKEVTENESPMDRNGCRKCFRKTHQFILKNEWNGRFHAVENWRTLVEK